MGAFFDRFGSNLVETCNVFGVDVSYSVKIMS